MAKPDREPMSLRALRDPMNEIILRLKMEGSSIKDEQHLEDFLRSVCNVYDRPTVLTTNIWTPLKEKKGWC